MADGRFSVFVSPKATRMLISCAAFLAAVDKNAALRLADEYDKAVASLSQLPYRGKRLEGEFTSNSDYRYLVFGKRYLLIYTVKDDHVFVNWVIDGRQDYQWIFQM